MKQLLVFGMFFLFLLSELPSISSEEIDKGKKLYINHCSACHNLEGIGKGIFPSLIDVADILGKEGIFTIIKDGLWEKGMPPIPNLSDQDLKDIYSYLKTLKKTEGEKTEGERGRRGEGAKKTEEKATDEEKPTKEKRKVLSADSLRAANIKQLTARAIAMYKVAAKLPNLFAELPCFCGCGWIDHSSLLDCFRTTHGAKCALCQEEAEVAERLYARQQLLKANTLQDAPKTLNEAERLRKEEAELNKKIALTLVKLFWKRRAIGGLHEF